MQIFPIGGNMTSQRECRLKFVYRLVLHVGLKFDNVKYCFTRHHMVSYIDI